MTEVSFSSWTGEILDNRGKTDTDRVELTGVKVPAEFEPGERVTALMGWNGLIVMDERVSIPDMSRSYMEAIQEASCGKCIPCRVGTRVMREILTRICTAGGEKGDLEKLQRLGADIMVASKCEIGKTGPIPVLHALKHYRKDFEELINQKKSVPRGHYRWHITAPCRAACPASLDVPGYVELIKEHRFEESLDLVRQRCPQPGTIGRVCIRPCEFNCRRNLVDDTIQIKFLKRFVADYEWTHSPEPRVPRPTEKKEKVAIIGAGPAGLSAAFYLRLKGFHCTIFEALPEGGGMAAVGIPDYRLPRNALGYEIDTIQRVSTEFRYNVRLGKDLSLEDIEKQGYKAILIAVGAHDNKKMRVEGEDAGYEGFIHGVRFLRDIALGNEIYKGKKIAVVGGGNVAIDCVRSAFRVGFEDVNLLYRRTRKEMPADDVEIEDAEKEGVKFNYLTLPVRILARDNKVVGLECIRMELGEPDASGRRRPVPIEGSEFRMDVDVVIPAIGQDVNLDFIEERHGIQVSKWNTVIVNEDNLATDRPGVFSAGDCVTGPDVLVGAMAAGYDSALAIEQYIRGEEFHLPEYRRMEKIVKQLGVYDPNEHVGIPGGWPKSTMEHLPPESRIHTFEEVERGFTPDAAIRDAERCLRCYRVLMLATDMEEIPADSVEDQG
ncbi:MAG: FAD-dependent oxidoreductase [Deltaproteobacteria bacterium]|nr:FAD-dependent oxidoreductase [Deltaproteobacteria bacterium]